MTNAFTYPGEELALFGQAHNWKKYFASFIKPYLKGRVMEAGAGTGATTAAFDMSGVTEWVMLEPDTRMFEELVKKRETNLLPDICQVRQGTIASLESSESFDCILYIDVLEHIEDDRLEISLADRRLRPGGSIVVLSPAFPYLYSAFDKAIGHYRRYNRSSLLKLTTASFSVSQCRYLDSVGFFASLANKWFLRQSYPTLKQVKTWDRWMVPVSRVTDPVFFYSFGKSILVTWTKQ